MKRRTIAVFLLLLMASMLQSQVRSSAVADRPVGGRYSPLSLTASPFVSIPVGADADVFGLGGGAGLSAELRLPFLPFMYTGAQLDYSFVSTADPATSLSSIGLQGLVGVSLQLMPILSMKVFGGAGGFLAFLNGPGPAPGGNPMFSGGMKLDFDLSDAWGLGVEGSYRYYGGLFNDVAVRLAGTYRVPPAAGSGAALPEGYTPLKNDGRGLRLIGLKAAPVFPVFFSYYETHPLGEVRLQNFEGMPADSVKLTVVVKGYMDNPMECTVPLRIGPGKDATAEVFALFNQDKLMEVAETTRLPLTFTLEYAQYGRIYREEYAPSIEVKFRNAMTWEDDRRMAAFISARDPAASGFARGVLAASTAAANPALDKDFQSAMFIYEALRSYGLSYAKDPSSPLASGDKVAVDTLNFPQQTLQSRTGDCDDLTILYCSLLESIGIESAFITTPGHVFPAFALGMTLNDALKYLGVREDYIVQDNRLWVPVEMTARSLSFPDAWKEGAREWSSAKDKAVLHPVHDAWTAYPPVVLKGAPSVSPLPSSSKLVTSLQADLRSLIDRELAPRAAELSAQAKQARAPERILNALGVLYARYGQYAKALEQFNAIIAKSDYLPALINAGNIYLTQKQYRTAIAQFQKALRTAPDSVPGTVGLALAQNGAGDRASAKATFERLSALDPVLAGQYAFLGSAEGTGERAASAEAASLPWQEE